MLKEASILERAGANLAYLSRIHRAKERQAMIQLAHLMIVVGRMGDGSAFKYDTRSRRVSTVRHFVRPVATLTVADVFKGL